jgi:putative hydrolase of the HAD superfamily
VGRHDTPVSIRAVLFDLGGVVVGSPLQAIRAFEAAHGIASGAVNGLVESTGPGGAWARLERGELRLDAFYPVFESECADAGVVLDARALMETVSAATVPRPAMLEAIARIRGTGRRVGALTNNWVVDEIETGMGALRDRFDVFVESAVEGLRKPDPRIYDLACDRLGVAPRETAFLDDIGRNLKPARALGMTTIKVSNPDTALRELAAVLGIPLG